MKIRRLLYGSYSILLVLLILLAGISIYGLSKSNRMFVDYVDGLSKRSLLAAQADAAIQERAVVLRNALLIPDLAERRGQRSNIDAADQQVTASLAAWREAVYDDGDVLPAARAEARAMFARAELIEQRYGPVARRIASHVLAGEDDIATAMIARQCIPLLGELDGAVNDYQNYLASQAALRIEKNTITFNNQRNILVSIAVFSIIFSMLVGHWITRFLFRLLGSEPSELNGVARRVAEGNLQGDGMDRIQDRSVLGSLVSMRSNLRAITQSINASSVSVSETSAALRNASHQNAESMQQSLQEVEQIVTAVHEMAITIQEVARNAESAASAAGQANQAAHESQSRTSEGVRRFNELADTINNTTQSMQRLKKESSNIGSVLDVIKSVADQTNLLALNAAIEAARAGDAGRGFAVVADEVRSLARRTSDATAEIERMVVSLQAIADESVGFMDQCQASSIQAVGSGQAVGEAVTGIVAMIEQINGMNQQIAAAVEEQSAVADQISQSIITVRDNAVHAGDAFNKAYHESELLAVTSDDLRKNMAQFKH